MKFIYILLLSIFPSLIMAQSGVQFTSPIPVADGAVYGFLRPKITLDANNNPVVLWGKASTHSIYVSTYNGAGFNAPVQINPIGTHPYMAFWYNADIKSSGDTIIAVFPTDMPANRVFMVKSVDGGNTWSDTIRVDNIPVGGIAYFPSCAINEYGNIAVAFMKHEAGWLNPRYVMTTSLDGGNSFSPDTNASAIASGEVCDCCPAHVIYENERQVLVFRNNEANTRETYASISIDNGASFNGMNVDQHGWFYPACPSVAPSAFISHDSLVTVFMSGVSGVNRIYVSTADIGSMQLGNIKMIDSIVPASTIQNHPRVAGKDSIMAMVWYNTMPGEADIYFRFSNSGAMGLIGDGLNISNPIAGTQQNPDIVYANGIFHIVYQNNASNQLYYLRAVLDKYVGVEGSSDIRIKWYFQNDQLTIISPENMTPRRFQMMDSRGQIVLMSELYSGIQSIDLHEFSSGIYFLKIEGYSQIIKFKK